MAPAKRAAPIEAMLMASLPAPPVRTPLSVASEASPVEVVPLLLRVLSMGSELMEESAAEEAEEAGTVLRVVAEAVEPVLVGDLVVVSSDSEEVEVPVRTLMLCQVPLLSPYLYSEASLGPVIPSPPM